MKKNKTFYITTPIYYASGPLHLGHLYCSIMAWTIRNYKKNMGYDTLFLTGSDEHGQKIENKALKANKSPQIFVDELVESYKKMWQKWHIDFDIYSRTTFEKHKKVVQNIFSWYIKNGFIYKDKYDGLYSIEDEEFLTKSQAVEKNGEFFHPSSGHKLINMSEESYFFDLRKLEKWWLKYLEKSKFLQPQKMVKEMLSNFINEGLENLSVTRKNVKWGIPIHEAKNTTLYVWLDALFNYVTALGYESDENKLFKKYWQKGNEIVHLCGKEISRFHFIYWPIFLEAKGLRQPTTIFSHGLLRDKDGRKMSKSLKNVIDPDYLYDKYDHEMIKYYFASQFIFGEDGNFSEDKLIDVINADLINNYGNLISRTVKMITNNFPKGIVYKTNKEKIFVELENQIKKFPQEFCALMDEFAIDKAYRNMIDLSSRLNKFIDETKPWTLTNKDKKLQDILSLLLNGIYAVSWAMQNSLVIKIKEVQKALNVSSFNLEEIVNFAKFDNKVVAPSFTLWKRIKV